MQKRKNISEVAKLEEKVLKSLEFAPTGKLRCEMLRGKYPQYYFVENGDTEHPNGRYIRKSEIEVARKLAQKEYDKLILREIKRLERIEKLTGQANGIFSLGEIHCRMPVAKQLLITPYVEDNASYIEKWLMSMQGNENDYPITNGYITERGENVRSKSEKMIADKLYLMKVPYVYEAKLVLRNGMNFYPDFTVLNVRTRQVLYYEHFGMMDNAEYCNKALEKIDMYESNNLFLGENFFFTMESSQKGINMSRLSSLIERKFL